MRNKGGELRLIADAQVRPTAAVAIQRGGLEQAQCLVVHQDRLIVDVHQDDRVRDAAHDQVEPITLEPNLLFGCLQPMDVLGDLLGGVAQVGNVGQDSHRAARAVEVVRRRQRAHLEEQLGAFDRIDQRQVMRGPTCRILFELAGAQCRGEQEIVHPDGAPFTLAVVSIGLEQCLGTHVLQDDVVVGVGQDDGISEPVDHPIEPLFFDGVLLTGVLQPLNVAGAHQGRAGLCGERHEPLDVGIADGLVLAEDDHSDGRHVPTLPGGQTKLLRAAPQRHHGAARDFHLQQQAKQIVVEFVGVVDPYGHAFAQSDDHRALGFA